jgi:hypothetical protein
MYNSGRTSKPEVQQLGIGKEARLSWFNSFYCRFFFNSRVLKKSL